MSDHPVSFSPSFRAQSAKLIPFERENVERVAEAVAPVARSHHRRRISCTPTPRSRRVGLVGLALDRESRRVQWLLRAADM